MPTSPSSSAATPRPSPPPPVAASSSNLSTTSHAPLIPSHLRAAHTAEQDDDDDDNDVPRRSLLSSSSSTLTPAAMTADDEATETTALLGSRAAAQPQNLHHPQPQRRPLEFAPEHVHPGPCNHGTFSPRPESSRATSLRSAASSKDFGGPYPGGNSGRAAGAPPAGDESPDHHGGLWRSLTEPFLESTQRKTTTWLAETHGITNTRTMYLTYYVPFFAWARQYQWTHVKGDFVAAISVASIYIPMALSLATNLGHIPPINGLYAFVINPLVYALLGSSTQMVVGPEAAGSLLVGSVVKASIHAGHADDDEDMVHARVAGVVTGLAGAAIFIAGISRLGFLDNVLSRPFLRGFISAIGFVIFVDQLIPELGLSTLAAAVGDVSHGSSVDKLRFLATHGKYAHIPTCIVAGVSFVVIMVLREVKRRLQPHYPSVAYFPDRFLVVVFSAVFCYVFDWEQYGVEVLGNIKPSGQLFQFNWPFQLSTMKHVRKGMGTAFLIALLGFFESSVAAKSLGNAQGDKNAIQGIQLSANRELVALGAANLVGGCFMALPAFGGYGRSKVNAATGGKTPMSSIFLSLITLISILCLMPYFHYLPKAVLSSMISVVAWSLIEEAPHDISFFVRVRGYTELGLMVVIFVATIFYSLELGMAIGVFLSLLSVIHHSTRPRIQILGRIPGTNRFENAEENPDNLEFIEGCLIVKIPEPLTFANTGDLRSRLRRLEYYGTNAAHPALPRVRSEEHNRNLIFDIHGVTSLDPSGAQVLGEIVESYRTRGVRVYFTRGPSEGSKIWTLFERSGILESVGGKSHFVNDIHEALVLTETEPADPVIPDGET